jgi:hypothetical protein
MVTNLREYLEKGRRWDVVRGSVQLQRLHDLRVISAQTSCSGQSQGIYQAWVCEAPRGDNDLDNYCACFDRLGIKAVLMPTISMQK